MLFQRVYFGVPAHKISANISWPCTFSSFPSWSAPQTSLPYVSIRVISVPKILIVSCTSSLKWSPISFLSLYKALRATFFISSLAYVKFWSNYWSHNFLRGQVCNGCEKRFIFWSQTRSGFLAGLNHTKCGFYQFQVFCLLLS